jgi:hypothetical protein
LRICSVLPARNCAHFCAPCSRILGAVALQCGDSFALLPCAGCRSSRRLSQQGSSRFDVSCWPCAVGADASRSGESAACFRHTSVDGCHSYLFCTLGIRWSVCVAAPSQTGRVIWIVGVTSRYHSSTGS